MSVASSSHPDPPREQPSPQEPNGPGATILGCAGESLTAAERRFFADADPLGFILFRRNCTAPEQVRALVEDLRATVGRPDAPVLLDQERSEEHTSELQSLMRISYAVFCLKKKKKQS